MVRVRVIAIALLATASLVGCSSSGDGGSDPTGTSTTSTSDAPEDNTSATAAEVKTNLVKIGTLAGQISAAAATDGDKAKTLAEGLEPLWQPIEGVVKKNDPDTYLKIEDAFANLESGDATKSAKGTTDVTAAIAAYVAKYPA